MGARVRVAQKMRLMAPVPSRFVSSRSPSDYAMRSALAVLTLAALAVVPTAARAQTLGFDNLNCGSGAGVGVYQTFSFNGFTCYNATLPNTGPANTAHAVKSFNNVIYNRAGSGATITRLNPFTFNSAWVTGAALNYPETYRFTGRYHGTTVGFVDVLTGNSPQFVTFNFVGIDTVLFTNISNPNANAGVLMDDLTFGASVTTAPEPASLALLSTGLLGIVAVGRRRRR